MSKTHRFILTLAITTMLLSNIFAMSAMAVAPPPMPNAFSGEVKIGGVDAPEGTVVYAYIDMANDTVPDGSITLTTAGYYEYLSVEGAADDDKKLITFVIDEKTAVQTAVFSIYAPAPAVLNLSDSGSAVTVDPEGSSLFENTTAPEEKEIDVKDTEDEGSNSLPGFTFLPGMAGLLLAIFVISRSGFKGDKQ